MSDANAVYRRRNGHLPAGGHDPGWHGVGSAALAGRPAVFYIPYFLLFTTFLHNTNGFVAASGDRLAYWLDQQDVQRGAQPVFYTR